MDVQIEMEGGSAKPKKKTIKLTKQQNFGNSDYSHLLLSILCRALSE